MPKNPLFSSPGVTLMLCSAFAVMFGLNIYSFFLRTSHPQAAHFLILAAPGIAISAVGFALLRSPLRHSAPITHVLCAIFHFLIASGLVAYAFWQCRQPV